MNARIYIYDITNYRVDKDGKPIFWIALVPVEVGAGKKIHAATVTEVQKGRHISRTYTHLCGSGNSSFMHNSRKASVRLAYYSTIKDVNCEKCLEAMNA